jgi:OFA family oxalate/formate antiporter-like MFS transporter
MTGKADAKDTEMNTLQSIADPQPRAPWFRWVQLAIGVICMAMIANLQYGWTLFVDPIDTKYHWGRPAIQLAFTIFVLTETWLIPFEAWFVDRYGPRLMVIFGAVMMTSAWVLNSYASSIYMLYGGAVLAGLGAGSIHGTCFGNALKWFPDRRGLASGVTAAGFGAGAALTVVPVTKMIASSGYEHTFFTFGLFQGLVVLCLSLFLRKPEMKILAKKKVAHLPQTKLDFTPTQTLRQPVFWAMYIAFVMVAAGGVMTAAQVAPIAHDYKIATVPVSLFGIEMAALTYAISLDRIFDGAGRPFFGWVSDQIGRENTMCIAFLLGALALLTLAIYGRTPVVFVLASALFFAVFGEIYSLFPATSGDTFGSKYAATNNGMLYTAKGVASLLVPITSLIAGNYGWYAVFAIAVGFNIAAAFLMLFIVKPMRRAFIERTDAMESAPLPTTALV